MLKVVAVVVTYNRAHLLKDCLDALHNQSRAIDSVVIVNNASTDDSAQVISEHPIEAEVINLKRNVGGAGGFTAGIAVARQRMNPDFLWLMDDDTIAKPDALEKLLAAYQRSPIPVSVLSSRAVWINGKDHPMNTSRTRLGVSKDEIAKFQKLGLRPIRTASFVSAFINARDIDLHGLPEADYFIWSDDFEYTGRILKYGNGFAVSDSVVEHRTEKFSNAQTNPGSRFYFDIRNRLWALSSDSFTLSEKLLYGGKSSLAWVKTLIRSRGDLFEIASTGVKDALFTKPRASDKVFEEDPQIATEIRAMLQSKSFKGQS